jgi:hypothetical protein
VKIRIFLMLSSAALPIDFQWRQIEADEAMRRPEPDLA